MFNGNIQPTSRDLLIADIDERYMNRRHDENGVVFKAYNIGLVASAATHVFLDAQARYTRPSGVFVFHAAGVMPNGLITAGMLRDQVGKPDAYETLMRAA